ncbi:MAG: hypothetical protein V1871_06055 [Planctomycetota bacterium]
MRKLTKVLMAAFLGVNLIGGVSIAQDKTQRPDQSDRSSRPEGKENVGRRPEGPKPGGPDLGMMDNPKVREEMKRHGEVTKGLFEQIKALHEKIRKELESKIGEPGNKGKIDPRDINRPGQPDKPNRPDNPGKDGRPQPPPDRGDRPESPDRQGNAEGTGPLPPEQSGTPPEGQGPGGQPREELLKILEPYRAEALGIADKIALELVTHHQNLLQIVTGEKENIKNALAEKILLPPPPRRGEPGREQRPDRSDRPDRGGRDGPDKGDRPEPTDRPDRPDRPDNPDNSDR